MIDSSKLKTYTNNESISNDEFCQVKTLCEKEKILVTTISLCLIMGLRVCLNLVFKHKIWFVKTLPKNLGFHDLG